MYVTLLIGKATGKHMHTSTRTKGATDAPIAKPYREQTDWGIIFIQVDICQSTFTDNTKQVNINIFILNI